MKTKTNTKASDMKTKTCQGELYYHQTNNYKLPYDLALNNQKNQNQPNTKQPTPPPPKKNKTKTEQNNSNKPKEKEQAKKKRVYTG